MWCFVHCHPWHQLTDCMNVLHKDELITRYYTSTVIHVLLWQLITVCRTSRMQCLCNHVVHWPSNNAFGQTKISKSQLLMLIPDTIAVNNELVVHTCRYSIFVADAKSLISVTIGGLDTAPLVILVNGRSYHFVKVERNVKGLNCISTFNCVWKLKNNATVWLESKRQPW